MRQVYFNATACIAVTAQLTSSKCAIYFSLLFYATSIHILNARSKIATLFIHIYVYRQISLDELLLAMKKL